MQVIEHIIIKDILNNKENNYNRYMELYKSYDVFLVIKHFNKMLLERKNYFFKSDTLNKIHGGKDYEGKSGIDLSTGADDFFKDLTKIIKDKPLYKVSGKIPIKLEVDYRRFYIDEDGYIHFVIDKDGTIYQTASLLRYTYHHNNHRHGVTIRNNNSIGIEVAAKYIET